MRWWWDRAERLKWELDQLSAAGFEFEDPGDLRRPGVIPLEVVADIDGRKQKLLVAFPELYPYFRFDVRAPELSLSHHQNPFTKSLCLIGRRSDNWRNRDSLADFLTNRLPVVVSAANSTSGEDLSRVEEQQAEPVSDYFPYLPEAMILVESEWILPEDFTAGQIVVAYEKVDREDHPLHGAVMEVVTADRRRLFEAEDHFGLRYTGRLRGDLVKVEQLVLEKNAFTFQQLIRGKSLPPTWYGNKHRKSLLAVVFPEETAWRTVGQGWIFVVGQRKGKKPPSFHWARAGRAGEKDLTIRTPQLGKLRAKKIAQFGLGCIGAPSALEFARAGVQELRILDRDFVDPSTTLRWPLGLSVVGLQKPKVIAGFVSENYPLTKVIPVEHSLGTASGDAEALEKLVDGADLIYDTTAELGIAYFLAELGRNTGIPYVNVSGTQGGWGGVVMRILPNGKTGCWYCFRRAQEEGLIPKASEDPAGALQPAGCADPTFTGASFDLSVISLIGVRMAVSILLEDEAEASPNPDAEASPNPDVVVISLRDLSGALIHPRIQGFRIKRFEDCPVCANSTISGSEQQI